MTTEKAGDNFTIFEGARDFLQANRTDHEAACKGFTQSWLETFNCAIDYFDHIVAGNDSPALWIVEEVGLEEICSFAQMSVRSSGVASHWD